MKQRTVAPFGSWKSEISAKYVTEAALGLSEIKCDGGDVYWLEGRPFEGGRNVIVRRTQDGKTVDVTPAWRNEPGDFNVRTAVHEYGGGSYAVLNGIVYFVNFGDQRLYRQVPGELPEAITPIVKTGRERATRFADMSLAPNGRFLICVRERHLSARNVINELVLISTDGAGEPAIVSAGSDFYSSPRISPKGGEVAWLSWDHPNMPWDKVELWLGSFDSESGYVSDDRVVAEGASLVQPRWSSNGTLFYVTDESGWWNLQARVNDQPEHILDAEFDAAEPAWRFGNSTYATLDDGYTVVRKENTTGGEIVLISPLRKSGRFQTPGHRSIKVEYNEIDYVEAGGGHAYFVGSSSTKSPELIQFNTKTGKTKVLKKSAARGLKPSLVSRPKPIEFPSTRGGKAYAYYYPPKNPSFEGEEGSLPPLLVISHGGPTSATKPSLNLSIQYWTSRGFAVVDVNYRGSTGYGREFRDALKGYWGIFDSDDCVAAARHIVNQNQADAERIAIRGGSAGGFTTVNCLTFHSDFSVGASYYGISDLEILQKTTHKFESRYLDSLVGVRDGNYSPGTDPYFERSANMFKERLGTPMIVLQGTEDKVVPRSLALAMVEALDSRNLPYVYLEFPGEGHGFRKPENLIRALEAELQFYGKVMCFKPADLDTMDPIKINNPDRLPQCGEG